MERGRLDACRGDRNGNCRNAAAWTLSHRYPVTVYDRELRAGGHSHTVTIDYGGNQIAVDIGFIVYNQQNYPGLTALFDHLDVETVESCMSFAVTADGGKFEWKGGGDNWIDTAMGLFAQPKNLISKSCLWMLRDILAFNQQSVADYKEGKLAGLTLGDYFRQNHFAPGCASWRRTAKGPCSLRPSRAAASRSPLPPASRLRRAAAGHAQDRCSDPLGSVAVVAQGSPARAASACRNCERAQYLLGERQKPRLYIVSAIRPRGRALVR